MTPSSWFFLFVFLACNVHAAANKKKEWREVGFILGVLALGAYMITTPPG